MDYSGKSIMEIVEAHLSPTPMSDGKVRVGGASTSGTNSDIDAAIAESGIAPYVSHNPGVEQTVKQSKGRRNVTKSRIVKGW